MARKLVNELTWSVSRDSLFQSCRRAYYYNYYGAWDGWLSNAPTETRQLYILKNVKSLAMWAGSIVHEVIAEALRRCALKNTPVRTGELQANARQKLRAGWVEAVEQQWLTSPKKTNLFELYYGNGKNLPKEQTERTRERINECLAAFAESALLKEMLAASYLSWKPIDQLDSFLLDGGLKVWCAVDFAFTDPAGSLRIIDWKSGGEKTDALRIQLACYAFYASEKWFVPVERQRLAGVFLRENARVSEYPVDEALLVEAKDHMLSSAAEMRAVLVDADRNIAREEDFPTCDNDRVCRWCNFREACPFGASLGAPTD